MAAVFTPQFLIQLAMLIATAGSVYGAIRAELRSLRRDSNRNARGTAKAHERIDALLAPRC